MTDCFDFAMAVFVLQIPSLKAPNSSLQFTRMVGQAHDVSDGQTHDVSDGLVFGQVFAYSKSFFCCHFEQHVGFYGYCSTKLS